MLLYSNCVLLSVSTISTHIYLNGLGFGSDDDTAARRTISWLKKGEPYQEWSVTTPNKQPHEKKLKM